MTMLHGLHPNIVLSHKSPFIWFQHLLVLLFQGPGVAAAVVSKALGAGGQPAWPWRISFSPLLEYAAVVTRHGRYSGFIKA